MVESIIFRVGSIIHLKEKVFEGVHGSKFIIENISVEDHDFIDAKCVRFRLRCTHCSNFLSEIKCLINKEKIRYDLERSDSKANIYTVSSVHSNDSSLVISRTLYEISGLGAYFELEPPIWKGGFEFLKKKELNPNILFKFQKRYGGLKR